MKTEMNEIFKILQNRENNKAKSQNFEKTENIN